ncbi:hypothetical protein G7Y89_g11647 [Cudoniella acicularis]|uniref:Large ribosomal subunit protein bL27m n=1 Tax=Cudoniella acicularis TaxID=354080 RepID=A0A8H4RCR1_9HELO|nr:hypothetical protein G7Y89_g11647 [Cudoniella acicularis]
MLLPRLQPPLRAAISAIGRSSQQSCLNEGFAALSIRGATPTLTFMRHASHAQQGAVNKAKDGPGKRLGAKKSGEQYVIPGNIIFRQRGTLWFPGENCAMGRDHTIYATESGYVKYYKDPEKHPKRQYIGVVFERSQVLPLPRNSMRRRKLNMTATKMEVPPVELEKVEVRTELVAGAEGNKVVTTKLSSYVSRFPIATIPIGQPLSSHLHFRIEMRLMIALLGSRPPPHPLQRNYNSTIQELFKTNISSTVTPTITVQITYQSTMSTLLISTIIKYRIQELDQFLDVRPVIPTLIPAYASACTNNPA